MFCSGGSSDQAGYFSATLRIAYLLSRDGTVEQLPNMLTARCLVPYCSSTEWFTSCISTPLEEVNSKQAIQAIVQCMQ